MEITAAAVKALRDRTNLPMMDCKAALTQAGGDAEKAVDILRAKFKDATVKFAGREAAEGRVAIFVDNNAKVGAIIEVRCETAPVAKADSFIALANDLAKHIALKNPASVEELLKQDVGGGKTGQDRITDVIGLIRENMKVQRFARLTGLCGEYVHHDGSCGALIAVDGEKADAAVLRDVGMHVVSLNPMVGKRDEVPAAVVAKETEIAKEQLAQDPKNKNKPANIMEKILEGKLKTFFAANVLVEQPFVKDDSKTVGELLKSAGMTLSRFIRYRVGEK
jgi:elongation factor Ts